MKPEFINAMHPNGLFYKNPTHLEEAERAVNQSDIVKMVNDSRRGRQHEIFKFDEESDRRFMPGTVKIREMDQETKAKYFKTLLKLRPNTYLIRLSLGNYPTKQEVKGRWINLIGSSAPRSYDEISNAIADLFEKHNIIDFAYVVDNARPGTFSSKAYAWETTDKEYNDNSLFKPVIEVEYISS